MVGNMSSFNNNKKQFEKNEAAAAKSWRMSARILL